MLIKKTALIICMFFCLLEAAQAQYGYFYTGKKYGSEAALSPLTQILNGSMDMLQTTNYDNTIKQMRLNNGIKGVFDALIHPGEKIRRIGFKKFADTELYPFGFGKTNSQWIPNYGLHLIGGGIEYARMTDYFAYHNFKYPRLWAALTSMTEQVINEAVELRGNKKGNFTIVADFYFFNIPGMILFSFEPIQKAFNGTISLRSWLGQGSYAPYDHSIRNTGQFYSVKIQPAFAGKFSFLYYMGAGWLSGLGYDYHDLTFSVAYGSKTEEVYVVDQENEIEFVKFTPSAAFFIDKNNSLLFSLVVATKSVYKENIRVNLYPEVLKIGSLSFGFWLNYSFKHTSFAGLTFRGLPGLAFQ